MQNRLLNFHSKDKSICLEKRTEVEYWPTSFNFSDDFVVNFSSKWMQSICTKGPSTVIHKKISYATAMEDDTNATESTMKFESSFSSSIHIGVRTNLSC